MQPLRSEPAHQGAEYTPADKFFENTAHLLRNMLGVESATIMVTDGQQRWLKASTGLNPDDIYNDVKFYAGVPIHSVNNEIIGTLSALDSNERILPPTQLAAIEDISRIVTDFYELRKLAVNDGLTGLLTRKAFEDEATRLTDLCRRHRHPLNVIYFDVDHFKSVNDKFGHEAGDKVLRAVSETCRTHLRQSDVFGRLGGEEFAVLLPETDQKGAILVAEKLRIAISAIRFSFRDETVGVTASFGVAGHEDRNYDLNEMLGRADSAMYEAKQSGRNRCVTWGSHDRVNRVVRRRVLKSGQIAFYGQHAVIDCTVRSLGQEGAGLDLVTTANVPGEFRLIIRSDDLSVACKVVERTRTHLEVEFV